VAREARRGGRASDADRRHGPGRFIALTAPAGADPADIRRDDLLRQFCLSERRVGMPKTPDISAFGSAYALTRFFMRLAIFGIFAALGQQEFGRALANMLILAVVYCVVAAAIRREQPFGPQLTHFDEAAAYAFIADLAAWSS
jgi:hypothetical protein